MDSKHHALSSTRVEEANSFAINFIHVYNARATFFSEAFVKKVKEGNRKALGELQRFPLPPTQMDLRQDFAHCVNAHVPDNYLFVMADGKQFAMAELKLLVPEWSSIAEKALIESDPALADKLMTPAQWNAKSAFEVTFTSAMNEIKEIRKTKLVSGSLGHYNKWIIAPLLGAIEHVKEVKPPGNALIGYGERISLAEAVKIAERLPKEFQKLLEK